MNLFQNTIDNDLDYLLLQMGKSITINNSPTTALISQLDKKYDNIKIITKSPLHRGDLILYNGNQYLITTEIINKKYDYYYTCEARHCNYSIKIDFSGIVKEFPVYIDSQTLGVDANKYLTTATGKIIVTLQSSADAQAITVNKRFIKMGSAWKITGTDFTQNNLLILYCDLDTITTDDDAENEIADRWKYETKHSYAFSISNKPAENIKQGSTYQVNITATDNGTAYTSNVTYTSSDTNIATIDANGLINAVGIGTTTITASDSVSGLSDSFSLEVVAVTYVVSITNKITNLNVNDTYTITTACTADGVEDTSPTLTYVSSDETIATVDSTGKITAIAAGNVTITVNYHNTSDSMNITVAQQDVITYTLTGSSQPDTEIKQGQTKTYTAQKLNNDVPVEGTQFDFTLTGDTSYCTFTIVNDTQCTIKNNDYTYHVTLRATDRADNTKYVEKTITLRSVI